jgi:hypothetical protein
VLSPANEVGHDQKVAGKAHLTDHIELALESLVIGAPAFGDIDTRDGEALVQPRFQPPATFGAQKILDGHALWHGKVGQKVLTELQRDVAGPSDCHAVGQGLRDVGEQLGHLLGRAQILLIGEMTGAARIVQHTPFVDAHPRLVGLEISRLDEAHVVAGDHGNTVRGRERDRGVHELFLSGPTRALQLEKQPPREDARPMGESLRGELAAAKMKSLPYLALRAREGEQAGGELREPFAIHGRDAAVLPLPIGARDQSGQVPVPVVVTAEQQ